MKLQGERIDAGGQRTPRSNWIGHPERGDSILWKIGREGDDVDIGIKIIPSASDNLDEFLKNTEKRTGNVVVEGVSGARIIVKMSRDIDKTNFIVKCASVERLLK